MCGTVLHITEKVGMSTEHIRRLQSIQDLAQCRHCVVGLAAKADVLATNLAKQFAVYATGRGVSFADRDDIAAIVGAANKSGGGVRTLLYQVIESKLFKTK